MFGRSSNSSPGSLNWFLIVLFAIIIIAGIIAFFLFLSPSTPPTAHESTPTPSPISNKSLPATPTTSSLAGKFAYAGYPQSSMPIIVLTNHAFITGYSESLKDPIWTCYRLFKSPKLIAPPRPDSFSIDERTKSRVAPSDYSKSGYDRGHMAPNFAIAALFGKICQRETFLISNIIPQSPALNRGIWKELEEQELDWSQDYGEVWIITGPIFDSDTQLLKHGIQIPDACYKLIADVDEANGRLRVIGFVMPQNPSSKTFSQYIQSIDQIEQVTGLDFYSELPDEEENAMEKLKPGMWR